MKKRNPAVVALLCQFTLGIYGIYWLHATRREILARHPDTDAIEPVWYLLAFPLVAFVMSFLSPSISAEGSIFEAARIIFTVVTVLGMLFGLLIYPLFWFKRYTKAVDTVTGTRNDFFVFFLLLYIFGFWFVWPAIVQSALNRIGTHTPGSRGPKRPTNRSRPSHQ